MKLSVIIVNYNVHRFVEQCVRSVLAAARGLTLEVFVVDNHSSDGSFDYLKDRFPAKQFPDVHLIAQTRNVGFGRANNNAARHARGEYILFLNPDTIVAEDTLASVIAFAESHADLGALGVRMLADDGRYSPESKRGLPTLWTAFCKMCGLTALFPKSRLFGRYYMGYLDDGEAQQIDVVSGAFMLVRNDGRAEWFDKDFFMYGEDIDLSFRLLKGGLQNYYLPTPIIHYKGESTNKSSFRYAHVFYEAMLIFLRKHYRTQAFFLYLPIKAAILLKACLSSLRRALSSMGSYFHPSLIGDNDRFIYFGRHADLLRPIAEADALEADYVEADERSLPEGHAGRDVSSYTYAIYDLSDYSRATVLRLLGQTAGQIRLGTFDPQTGQLIYHWHNRKQ